MKKLVVVNGHPDPRPNRFCAALCDAYQKGAAAAGWQVSRLDIGRLPLSCLEALRQGQCDDAAADAMLADIESAQRLAVVYPLWFDQPPEGVRSIFSYLDQVQWSPAGRKAHVIVTMDMPAFAYRTQLRPGVAQKPLMLDLPGLIPEEPVLIGCVSSIQPEQRQQWLAAMQEFGERTNLGAAVTPTRIGAFAAAIDRTVSQWWAGL